MGLAWLWEVKNYNTVIATLVAMHPLAGSQVSLDLKPLGVAGLVRHGLARRTPTRRRRTTG